MQPTDGPRTAGGQARGSALHAGSPCRRGPRPPGPDTLVPHHPTPGRS